MLEKLKALELRYEDLQNQLGDPKVYSDSERLRQVNRELKELYLCGGGAAIMALRETVADTVNLTVRGGEELLDGGMRPAEEPWLYLRAIGSVCEGGLK